MSTVLSFFEGVVEELVCLAACLESCFCLEDSVFCFSTRLFSELAVVLASTSGEVFLFMELFEVGELSARMMLAW